MLVSQTADQQAVAATSIDLVWQGVDSDGEPADPGTVTVGVTNAAGTVVVAAGTATTETGTTRTYTLTAAQTADIDILTATWTASGVVLGTTTLEIIGTSLLTRAKFQELQQNEQARTAAELATVRKQADHFLLGKLNWSMVPRLAVERIHSTGLETLPLAWYKPRSVKFANLVNSDGTRTAIDDIDEIGVGDAAVADLGPHDCWPVGDIEIGYVHGDLRPTPDAERIIARVMKGYLGEQVSTLDDRTQTYSDGTGATYSLIVEGTNGNYSNIPAVNEYIRTHRRTAAGVA